MGGTQTTHEEPVNEPNFHSELSETHHATRNEIADLFLSVGEKLKNSKTYKEVHDVLSEATERTATLGDDLFKSIEDLAVKAKKAIESVQHSGPTGSEGEEQHS